MENYLKFSKKTGEIASVFVFTKISYKITNLYKKNFQQLFQKTFERIFMCSWVTFLRWCKDNKKYYQFQLNFSNFCTEFCHLYLYISSDIFSVKLEFDFRPSINSMLYKLNLYRSSVTYNSCECSLFCV